ncbi:MAG: hypothetical protein WAK96_06910 [Desulfobaccales bacterium]
MKDYSLYYWDRRLSEAEVVDCLERAWNELYDLEFDAIFGAWRGVHLEEETDTVHVTWETMYGGPPLMISISRSSGAIKMDFPRAEFVKLEEAEIERLLNQPPKGRR